MKIAIIPNYHKGNAKSCTEEIIKILKSHNCSYIVHEYTYDDGITKSLLKSQEIEVVIVVGGDGTIIHTAKIAAELKILILGINAGNLGFTAGIEGNELKLLNKLITGEYETEKRILMDVEVLSSDKKITISALNDIVVSSNRTKIMDYCLSINKSGKYEYRADGFIVATPTGSTAYSLSAGGPVVEPVLDCFVYTPICPHSLFNRSLIFSSQTKLFVEIRDNDNKIILTADGRDPIELKYGDKLIFSKSDLYASFLRIDQKHFYDILNKKIISNNLKAKN